MNKTQAIKHARKCVSALSRLGDGWIYLTYDNQCAAWRQSTPRPYYEAIAARRVALVEAARRALGWDDEAVWLTDIPAGEWTKAI